MITSRHIKEQDYKLLEESLSNDEYHQETTLDFFLEPGTITNLYYYNDDPICFVRGKPWFNLEVAIIQLDIQFLSNEDKKRNIKVMLEGFKDLEQKAKENGFMGLMFNSNVDLLRNFCIKRLGFEPFEGDWLVKTLDKSAGSVV